MGTLTLPNHGSVYLDACGFIYGVERIKPCRRLLEPVWQQATSGQLTIVTSELSVMETLVKPLRDGDEVLQGLFQELFHSTEVRLGASDTGTVGRCRRSTCRLEPQDPGRAARGDKHPRTVYLACDQ